MSALQRKVKRAENATESDSKAKGKFVFIALDLYNHHDNSVVVTYINHMYVNLVLEVLRAVLKRKSDDLNSVMQQLQRLNPEQSVLRESMFISSTLLFLRF